jgi:hypothetical protein
MNKYQLQYLQTKYVDVLAAQYKGKANYHGLNLLGPLQVAGGVPGAAIGKPVLTKYSPPGYVVNQTGPWECVHLTQMGYRAMYKQLVKQMGFE